MTRESEFLLATLRGTSAPETASFDWPALFELADTHGVLPIFCRQFRGTLPDRFVTRNRGEWKNSASLSCDLELLLKQFSLSGLDVLPLKGPLLGQALYGSPALRPCDDLDLLVSEKDFGQAQALLTDLGFEPAYDADDYHRTFQRRNTCVELHFSVAPPSSPTMDLQGAWARSRLIQFRGQKTRLFATPDLVIYLTIHGVKHEFSRLIWVLDFAKALAELDQNELDQVLTMAQSLGIQGALLTAAELARLCFHSELSASIADAIAHRPAISAQAGAICGRILKGPANPQTDQQGAGHFLRLEQNVRARWAQRLRYFRLSQQDRLWARQHHIHPLGMLFLRPLRLLAKHGPGLVWHTLFPLER
jgi:hypothetical protein